MKDDITLDTEAEQGYTKRDRAAERLMPLLAEYAGGGYANDLDTLLMDLLTDLRHWSAANGVEFDAAAGSSRMHFAAESDDVEASRGLYVPTITISLEIENAYENYEDVTTYATDVVMPAPPAEDAPEYDDWAYDHIFALTGVGHEDGDSWYDVTVTACSDPSLVGRTFDFGY